MRKIQVYLLLYYQKYRVRKTAAILQGNNSKMRYQYKSGQATDATSCKDENQTQVFNPEAYHDRSNMRT